MGITPDAVRSRLRRGTLIKEVSEDGTVYVRLGGDGRNGHTDQPTDRTTDQPTVAYITSLRSENELLRHQLEAWQEEARRKDHLIAALIERVPPQIESPERAPESPRTDAEEPEGVEDQDASEGDREGSDRPSWWRRWFGV